MITKPPTRTVRPTQRKTMVDHDISSDQLGISILNRVVQPDAATLTPDAARVLLSLKFEKSDQRQMEKLAAKARQGALTERERAEAEQYNLVSHMLALLQAKARGALAKSRRASEPA